MYDFIDRIRSVIVLKEYCEITYKRDNNEYMKAASVVKKLFQDVFRRKNALEMEALDELIKNIMKYNSLPDVFKDFYNPLTEFELLRYLVEKGIYLGCRCSDHDFVTTVSAHGNIRGELDLLFEHDLINLYEYVSYIKSPEKMNEAIMCNSEISYTKFVDYIIEEHAEPTIICSSLCVVREAIFNYHIHDILRDNGVHQEIIGVIKGHFYEMMVSWSFE